MSSVPVRTLFGVDVASQVRLWTLGNGDRERWDAFVQSCPEATFFHLAGWKNILENVLGHQTFYLYAESANGIEGVLALAHVTRRLFGNPLLSGTHLGVANGFILAVGDGIKPGVVLRDASVLDLAPTMLYLMGLPVARDMEGRVLAEMVAENFASAHPVNFLPSLRSLAGTAWRPPGTDLPPPADEAP